MKLFRGYKSTPKFLLPKLEEELDQLRREQMEVARRVGANIIGVMREFGIEKSKRLMDLNDIAKPQFFTDMEEAARGYAADNGFLIVLEIGDEIARAHYDSTQNLFIKAKGETRPVDNFVFKGKELAAHLEDKGEGAWKFDLISIKEEREGKEGIAAMLRDGDNPKGLQAFRDALKDTPPFKKFGREREG